MNRSWKIPESSADWECDWDGSERFRLRYFKSLTFSEKIRAVEHMCETAEYFRLKAVARRSHRAPVKESAG